MRSPTGKSLKAPRRWPTSPSLSSICLLQNFNYGGGAHINCCDKLSPTYLLVKSHSLIDSEISLSHEPPFSCLDAPLSTALSRCIAFHISRHIIQVYRCTPPCHLYTHTSPGSPLSWVHLSRPGLVTMCIDVIVFVSRGILLCSFHGFPRLFGPRSGSLDGCAALSLCYS